MKRFILISFLILSWVASRSQTLNAGQLNPVPLTYDGTSGGTDIMYIYLPWDYYADTTKKYPVIFFWTGNNGVGDGGSDLTKLLTQDLPYQINNGKPPYSVSSGGDTTRFIVTIYQPSTTSGINSSTLGSWTATMKWLVGTRVDVSRVYYMGSSQGAGDMLNNFGGADSWRPVAMIDMNPWFSIPGTTLEANAQNTPIWFFQDDDDNVVGQNGTTYYNDLHDTYPDSSFKLTQFVGEHAGPERTGFYDPAWSDDTSTRTVPHVDNTSIYDWVMKFSDPTQVVPEFTINIGSDTTVSTSAMTFGSTVVHMDGNTYTATSTEHAPTWKLITKASSAAYVTGGFYALNTKGLANLNTNGDYTASLTLTNDYQITKSDTIKVTKITGNVNPIANAGSDQSLDAGTTSTTLTGSGTDADGSIVSYLWTTSSGASITDSTSATTAVTGLTNGNTYTFTLTVTDDSDATGSDNVTVTVAPTPPDTASYQILLSQDTKFWDGDTVFYQFLPISGGTYGDSLIDEQSSDSPITRYWTNYTSQVDYPNDFILDLGGMYKITKISFYSNNNFAYIDAIGGTAPEDFYDTIAVRPLGKGVWNEYDDTLYTRYLKVSYDLVRGGGSQMINEMKLYGHLVGSDSLSRVNPNPAPPDKTPYTMGYFMGINQVGPQMVDSVGLSIRHYQEQSWLDTSTQVHNVDSVKFVFNTYGHPTDNTSTTGVTYPMYFPNDYEVPPYYSTALQSITAGVQHQLVLDSSGMFDAIQNAPGYANAGKSVDTAVWHDPDYTDPNVYDRLARMMWTYTAFFGNNAYSSDSMQTPYPDLSGLNLRYYVEEGNEMNGSWKGNSYYTAKQYMAYASAFYDGDQGKMGSRMGVKGADSSMVVVKAGTAGADVNRLKLIHYWTRYMRGGKPAFDILNIHNYPSNGTNGAGTNAYGYSPEVYFGNSDNPIKRYVAAANDAFPGMPVWLTEWGYDRNRATKISVPPIDGLDSTTIQGMFISRFWLMLSFTGIARSNMFELMETSADSVATQTFMSSGLMRHDGIADLPDGGLTHVWYAYPAYYMQKTLYSTLFNYKPDSIVYDNHDSIYVYRYRNATNTDSVAYAIWSGTQTNRSTTNYAIKTGHASTSTRIITLADKAMYGDTTNATSGTDSTVNLTITETPQILFTTAGTDGGTLVDTVTVETGPTANAGPDQTIRLPTNSVTLAGSATEGTSAISTHVWSKVSGSGGTITTPTSYTSTVTGLTAGTYVLKLVVTDENGLKDSDEVTITVNAAYVGPTAHAGTDQTLDPGTTSTTLSGSATEGDGTITGYAWTQVSGTTVTIGSPTSASTSISGLADGNTYVFRLTVMDSNDLTDSDDVQVTVSSTPPPTGTLTFKWLRNIGGHYYLIYENASTGRYYYWKIL